MALSKILNLKAACILSFYYGTGKKEKDRTNDKRIKNERFNF
jgi:hypothetical protein